MDERLKIIKLNASMRDPKGILIPQGRIGHLHAEIADEVATFWFTESYLTRRFASLVMRLEAEKGKDDTQYIGRVNKIITKYPNKTKEEIRDIVLDQLNKLGGKIKE